SGAGRLGAEFAPTFPSTPGRSLIPASIGIFFDGEEAAAQVGVAHPLDVAVAPERVETVVVGGVPMVYTRRRVGLFEGAAALAAEAAGKPDLVLPDDQRGRRPRDGGFGLALRRGLGSAQRVTVPEVDAVASLLHAPGGALAYALVPQVRIDQAL